MAGVEVIFTCIHSTDDTNDEIVMVVVFWEAGPRLKLGAVVKVVVGTHLDGTWWWVLHSPQQCSLPRHKAHLQTRR